MSSSRESAVLTKHQKLYKGAATPPWKETYRKRCINRLKQSREKFLLRFRQREGEDGAGGGSSLVEDLMAEEWKALRRERPELPAWHGDSADNPENINHLLSLFDEIQDELKREEQRMVEQYEESLLSEDAALCAAVEGLHTQEVICPICQQNPVMLNKGIFFCKCGMRVNTQADCLTLANLEEQLAEGVRTHGEHCSHEAIFSVIEHMPITNLIMACQECDFMFIVI